MVANTRSRSSLSGVSNSNVGNSNSSGNNRRTTLGPISSNHNQNHNRRVSMAGSIEADRHNPTKKSTTMTSSSARKQQQRMSMIPRISSASSSNSNSKKNSKSKSTKGRKSMTPAKTASSKSSRKSMGGSTSTSPYSSSSSSRRQSSIPPPTTMRTDIRPISDKTYFNTCLKSLYSYLRSNGYEYDIDLKKLARPSGKDFRQMMVFLLSKIDESFYHNHGKPSNNSSNSSSSNSRDNNNKANASKRKFEDDVVNTFRTLGYPFNISKTSLVAAGAPHTWPSLLLAITWLIELLDCMGGEYLYEDDLILDLNSYGGSGDGDNGNGGESQSLFSRLDDYMENGSLGENNTNMNTTSNANRITSLDDNNTIMDDLVHVEQKIKTAMSIYVERSYKVYFFDGDDETYAQMETELLEYIEKDFMMIEEALQRITEENALVVEQISEVQREVDDLPEHEKRLEKLAEKLEYFHDLVEALNKHKNDQYAKVQERNAELELRKEDMAKIEARIQGIIETIASQEYTKEDVHQLERQRAKLEETLARLLRKREEYENLTVKAEIDLKREMDRLERFVVQYNDSIEELPFDDSDDDVVVVTKVAIEKEMTNEKEQKWLLGQVDLKNVVIPLLRKMEQKYMEETAQLRIKSYELVDIQAKAEDALAELKDTERSIKESIRRVEETYQQEKQDHEEALSVREKEVKTLEEKVETLRDPSAVETVISKYQSQINNLSTLKGKHREGNLVRKQAVLDELNEALTAVSEYERYRENEIRLSRKYLESIQHLNTIKSLSSEQENILSL